MMNPQQLIAALQTRGLLAPEPSDAVPLANGSSAIGRPWFISLLLGASGWLAGAFVLVFVGLLFKPNSSGEALSIGLVLIAAAWGLFKADRDGAFVAQLALALSVAGQILVLWGCRKVFGSNRFASLAWAALPLQLTLMIVMPNHMHRIMSALFACAAWAMALRFTLFGESTWSRQVAEMPSPLLAITVWLLAWLPVGTLIAWLVRGEAAWMARHWQPIVRPVLTGLITGLAFATVITHPFETFWDGSARQSGALALWPLLAALASLGALAAAFALRSRALMGACLIAALLHVSHFYYALGTGLLVKSVIMLAMGAAMLVAAHIARRGATT
jgi:Domain of unknown function (DUF4401)